MADDRMELRYHNAMPGWCKIIGLKIRAIHECEGGGFAIEQKQAEAIVKTLTAPATSPSRSSGSASNGAQSFMDLMTAKAAKDLTLDTSTSVRKPAQ